MMGGEFCVNATRGAALLLARQGLSGPLPGTSEEAWGAELTVSGMDRPVPVLAATDSDALEAALVGFSEKSGSGLKPASEGAPLSTRMDRASLHCAARIDCAAPGIRCLEQGPGVTLVSLPGIQHLLVDAASHPLPDTHSSAWKTASAAWRAKSGLVGSPASGVVWYERLDKDYRIWPAVEVAATGSEHLETACGSASLAMALVHHSAGGGGEQRQGGVSAVDVVQPSDEALRIFLIFSSSGILESAWIAGLVRLAAQGTAYL